MPDPRLIEAMEKIKVILNTYDIAAFIFLDSPTHTEYFVKLDPSWTCIKMEERDGELGFRFRATETDYGSKDKRNEAIARSMGVLFGHAKTHQVWQENCEKMIMMASKSLGLVESRIVDEGMEGRR